MKRLVDQPHYAYGWKVSNEFVFEEDGKEWREYAVGVIGAYKTEPRGCGVVFMWKIVYNDGDVEHYECEELVNMLLMSRRAGLDITGCGT
ncbi:hypothetical protein V7S43_014371 [Phytophthora oleae]|uniref:Uncharacterized protein n=1 Tax=Phytophthora oleae TaxID=2107226 RepID=A0ABD3F2I4_9STRA